MDVTAGVCWEEGTRLHLEMGGQPVLVLCLDPSEVGRLLWGLWDELGSRARAGMAHREQQCWHDALWAQQAQFPCRTGEADISSAHTSWGFAAQNSLWEGEQGKFHREKKTTGGKAAGKLCSRGAEAPIPSCRLQLCLSSLQLTSPMASCHGTAAAAACSICVLPVTRLEYFWGCWPE